MADNNRIAEVVRTTRETDIRVRLNLDGAGVSRIDTGIPFLNHMLELFARHGFFDLDVVAKGDLEVDQHHLMEDTGIVLGNAFSKALGDKKGIKRAGFFIYPMDETLAAAAVDFGGRPYLVAELSLSNIPLVSISPETGTESSFQTDTVTDFWQGFVTGADCNLHLDIIRGRSDHHKIEAVFKAAAKALKEAVLIEERVSEQIPSTKGII